MILQQLQAHFRSHTRASIAEVATHFNCEPEAIRGMLTPIIRKGRLRKLNVKQCGGCQSCQPETLEFYEWVGSSERPHFAQSGSANR